MFHIFQRRTFFLIVFYTQTFKQNEKSKAHNYIISDRLRKGLNRQIFLLDLVLICSTGTNKSVSIYLLLVNVASICYNVSQSGTKKNHREVFFMRTIWMDYCHHLLAILLQKIAWYLIWLFSRNLAPNHGKYRLHISEHKFYRSLVPLQKYLRKCHLWYEGRNTFTWKLCGNLVFYLVGKLCHACNSALCTSYTYISFSCLFILTTMSNYFCCLDIWLYPDKWFIFISVLRRFSFLKIISGAPESKSIL